MAMEGAFMAKSRDGLLLGGNPACASIKGPLRVPKTENEADSLLLGGNSASASVKGPLSVTKTSNEAGVDDTKRTTWSVDEDKVLVRSWASTSNNAVTGKAQKDQACWKRITNYYNEHRPDGTVERRWKMVKSHFYMFLPMVNEFFGIYNNLYSHRQSGWSDEHVLVKAHEIWKETHKSKPFKYEHVWRILRKCEKYAPQSVGHRAEKKARISESRAHTSSSTPDTSVDVDHCEVRTCSIEQKVTDTSVDVDDCEVHTHPIEQKVAKKKGKAKLTFIEKMQERIDNRLQRLEEYQQRKLAVMEKLREEMSGSAFRHDYEILMKDTEEMTPEQLHVHLQACEIIKKRYGIS